jgi:hypothetical protein
VDFAVEPNVRAQCSLRGLTNYESWFGKPYNHLLIIFIEAKQVAGNLTVTTLQFSAESSCKRRAANPNSGALAVGDEVQPFG